MSEINLRVEGRYRREHTDSGLLRTALHVEEVAALAYATAAGTVLEGRERARAVAFAAQEREHAAALQTLLLGLTVPVLRHAAQKDVEDLMPGFEALGRDGALAALLELEEAAIAGQQGLARTLIALDALRTVAMVMAGGAQHLVILRDVLRRTPITTILENG
jgi:rubrerythrin